jgi:chemotaxis protein CheD
VREDDPESAGAGVCLTETPPRVRVPVYLHPGSVYASTQAAAVSTILGSSVGVSLFDPRAGLGGMTHYVLPRAARNGSSARFGDVAVRQLLERVLVLGADREMLQARVFGGAWMNVGLRENPAHVGLQNVQLAHDLLAGEGIPVVAAETGGASGRRLVFHTDDGSAWVRAV